MYISVVLSSESSAVRHCRVEAAYFDHEGGKMHIGTVYERTFDMQVRVLKSNKNMHFASPDIGDVSSPRVVCGVLVVRHFTA
jgi:hypothetical protein